LLVCHRLANGFALEKSLYRGRAVTDQRSRR
jgi:hypothetical protein